MEGILDKVDAAVSRHNLINAGEKVLIGVSGGPDSVCLLHALHMLSERFGISLLAVHVNHMLRGDESDADEDYVSNLCKSLSIEFISVKIDIKDISSRTGMSLEEAGRDARYSTFKSLAQKYGAARIAVAHNKNDQAETILMNIIRGTGFKGLLGMAYDNEGIIRPLLGTERKEIEGYCTYHGLLPRTDSSNLEKEYTRNKLRLGIIPLINEATGGDLTDRICRMASILAMDADFIDINATHAYESCIVSCDNCMVSCDNNVICLNIEKLETIHRAIRSRVFRLAMEKLKGNLKGIEYKHIEDIDKLLDRKRTGSTIELPSGLRAMISYKQLRFFIDSPHERNASPVFCSKINIPGITAVLDKQFELEAFILEFESPESVDKIGTIGYNSLEQVFDYDRIIEGINIRNRMAGDRFIPLNSACSKKLKEYFIDKKIPRERRDNIPLVAMDSEIVWIVGHKTSDKFKVTENTKRVLKLVFKYINSK